MIINMKDNYEIKIADYDEAIKYVPKNIAAGINYGAVIIYYGYLNGEIISEGRAYLKPKGMASPDEDTLNDETACLSSFKTKEKYQNQGYFSRLYKFIIEDLKNRGIKYVSLGIYPNNERNMNMYSNWGFNEYIKSTVEDSENIDWYKKKI